jgi:hypothetical protein
MSVFVRLTAAGVVITTVEESYPHSAETDTGKVFIGENAMRVESGADGEDNIVIFRNDRKVFWIINTNDKTYTEMTKNDIREIKNQMDKAMQMMEEQMKNLPPEQRAMMEQMMKGSSMPAQPEKTVYKKVASGLNVNRWKCDKYEGYRSGKLIEEVWTTEWENLGIQQKDFLVMQSMGDFVRELTKDVASHFHVGSDEWEKEQGYPGIPVRKISYFMGRPKHKTEIMDVKREAIDPSLFDLSPGFRKQTMPGMQ